MKENERIEEDEVTQEMCYSLLEALLSDANARPDSEGRAVNENRSAFR